MSHIRVGFKAVGLLFVLLAGTSFLQAQLTRSWVSGVGDDANACSRTMPCKTFAGAFAKTNAGGEIDALDAGGFGVLTITKSITIDGGGGTIAGILPNGVPAFTISAGANDTVTLRNISINGNNVGAAVSGILFTSGAALYIENCVIFHNSGSGVDFEPTAGGSRLFVVNSTLRENGTAPNTGNALIKPPSNFGAATFSNVIFERGGFGLRVDDFSVVTVRDSVATSNFHNGFLVVSQGGLATLTIENSTSVINGTNGISSVNPNATIRLSGVTVTDNQNAGLLSTNGGQILSFTQGGAGTNNVAGNGPNGGGPTGTIPRQ